ncbi:MAG: response regulator [Chitinophagaceae bacterium]
MNEGYPIYIVDDDQDDQEFVKEIFGELKIKNQLCFFNNGKDVLSHLKTLNHTPFLILCDVNIPLMDGFELRKLLLDDETLVYKSVPFIFWSNVASNAQIKKAYDLAVHGFFVKGKNYAELKTSLQNIFAYWKESKQPEI